MAEDFKIDVHLDGDAVDQYVAKAVLESKIGEKIKAGIDDVLNQKSSYIHTNARAIQSIIEGAIRSHVTDMLIGNADFAKLIRDKMEAAVIEKMTDDVVGKMVDKMISDNRY